MNISSLRLFLVIVQGADAMQPQPGFPRDISALPPARTPPMSSSALRSAGTPRGTAPSVGAVPAPENKYLVGQAVWALQEGEWKEASVRGVGCYPCGDRVTAYLAWASPGNFVILPYSSVLPRGGTPPVGAVPAPENKYLIGEAVWALQEGEWKEASVRGVGKYPCGDGVTAYLAGANPGNFVTLPYSSVLLRGKRTPLGARASSIFSPLACQTCRKEMSGSQSAKECQAQICKDCRDFPGSATFLGGAAAKAAKLALSDSEIREAMGEGTKKRHCRPLALGGSAVVCSASEVDKVKNTGYVTFDLCAVFAQLHVVFYYDSKIAFPYIAIVSDTSNRDGAKLGFQLSGSSFEVSAIAQVQSVTTAAWSGEENQKLVSLFGVCNKVPIGASVEIKAQVKMAVSSQAGDPDLDAQDDIARRYLKAHGRPASKSPIPGWVEEKYPDTYSVMRLLAFYGEDTLGTGFLAPITWALKKFCVGSHWKAEGEGHAANIFERLDEGILQRMREEKEAKTFKNAKGMENMLERVDSALDKVDKGIEKVKEADKKEKAWEDVVEAKANASGSSTADGLIDLVESCKGEVGNDDRVQELKKAFAFVCDALEKRKEIKKEFWENGTKDEEAGDKIKSMFGVDADESRSDKSIKLPAFIRHVKINVVAGCGVACHVKVAFPFVQTDDSKNEFIEMGIHVNDVGFHLKFKKEGFVLQVTISTGGVGGYVKISIDVTLKNSWLTNAKKVCNLLKNWFRTKFPNVANFLGLGEERVSLEEVKTTPGPTTSAASRLGAKGRMAYYGVPAW